MSLHVLPHRGHTMYCTLTLHGTYSYSRVSGNLAGDVLPREIHELWLAVYPWTRPNLSEDFILIFNN